VSVIVPVFNAQESLERCVRSALDQGWGDVEVLVVDNNSADDSYRVAQRIARQDKRVQVLVERKQGVSAARNAGLRIAKGDWVTFLDSDDAWAKPDYLETLLMAAAESDAQVVGLRDYTVRRAPDAGSPVPTLLSALAATERMMRLAGPTSVWAHVFRRELLVGTSFPEDIHIFEDAVFTARALGRARRVVLVPGPLYLYTPAEASANTQPFNARWLTMLDAGQLLLVETAPGGLRMRAAASSFNVHCIKTLGFLMWKSPEVSNEDLRRVVRAARAVLQQLPVGLESLRLVPPLTIAASSARLLALGHRVVHTMKRASR